MDEVCGYCACRISLAGSQYFIRAMLTCCTILIINDHDAMRYYQNTEFDRKTQWSNFLKLLDIMPSAFTNTMRQHFGLLFIDGKKE